jgi:hypothetical protein
MAAGCIVQLAGCALAHDPADYYASNTAECKEARPASMLLKAAASSHGNLAYE